MSFAERLTATITATAGSTQVTTTLGPFTGTVETCIYTNTDLSTGLTLTLKTSKTSQTIWSEALAASKTVQPRVTTHLSTSGVAATYGTTGGTGVLTPIWAVAELINITAALPSTGAAGSGKVTVIVQ